MAASALTPHGTAFPEEGRCGYFCGKEEAVLQDGGGGRKVLWWALEPRRSGSILLSRVGNKFPGPAPPLTDFCFVPGFGSFPVINAVLASLGRDDEL